MQDLIKQIIDKTGIPADKAQQVLGVVAGFVKEKFPMMGGQIDSLLGTSSSASLTPGSEEKKDADDLLGNITGKFGL
jgi:hypothetical protein